MGCSNATFVVLSLVEGSISNMVHTIDKITISTLRRCSEFGDMTYTNNRDDGAGASATRMELCVVTPLLHHQK